MQDLSDDDRGAVLGEVLMGELRAIREYVENVPSIKRDVAKLKEDMIEVKADIKVIKAVLTDHGRQIDDHEVRIGSLEAAR